MRSRRSRRGEPASAVHTPRFRPGVQSLEDRCTPAVGFALSNNALIPFDTANPAAAAPAVTVTGLTAGDTLVGIDFRPQNGFLYGLGFNSAAGTVQLYHVSHRTGVATAVGASGTFVAADGTTPVPVMGTNFGFDFNPTVDRVRVVTDAGQNFRMNPNNGAFVDGDLGGAAMSVPGLNMDGAVNGATTMLDAAAYTNNQQNVTVTTLYTLDAASDKLLVQVPPNAGTQVPAAAVTLDGSPLDFAAANGFDIPAGVNVAANNAPATGLGFTAMTVGGSTFLYSIELSTGATTLLGTIGAGTAPVQGFAVQSEAVAGGAPAVSLSADGTQLMRFNTQAASTALATTVTGVDAGEVLVGIDWRPQTGQLFGLGVNDTANTATLYRLDPQTGAATAIGAIGQIAFVAADGTPVDLPAATAGYGFDFNPTVDRVRVVTNTGLNFRANPNNGAPVDGDAGPAGTQTDGAVNGLPTGSTGVTAAAYTNAFGQSLTGGVTTQYTLDATSDMLFIQNPPNTGTQTAGLAVTLGGAPLDFTEVNGFDIPGGVRVAASNTPATGRGFAVLTVGGATNLYSIELSTGAATLIGPVGAGGGMAGLSLGDAPAGAVAFSAATFTAAENGTTATITLTRTGGSSGAATADVAVAGGTATASTDFVAPPATVTFADGQTTATVQFMLLDDTDVEGDETVLLTLSNPTGGVLGGQTSATLTLTDNDAPALQPATAGGLLDGTASRLTPSGGKYAVGDALSFFPGLGVNVRTATADVTGDGVADVVGGTGPGIATLVTVLDGATGKTIVSFTPFEASFTGGLYVAAADMDGDGKAEVVVSPDRGGGPVAAVYAGAKLAAGTGGDGAQIVRFFGIDDPAFRGGARVALGDVTGDGKAELVVAAGFLGGPRVTVWDGASILAAAPGQVANFFVFEDTLRNGAFVAAGDVTGDGAAEVAFGGGPGGAPRVRLFDGPGLLAAFPFVNVDTVGSAQLANFFAGDSNLRGGVRLALRDAAGDGTADLLTGSGEGEASRVLVFTSANLLTNPTPSADQSLDPFGGVVLADGVFVG